MHSSASLQEKTVARRRSRENARARPGGTNIMSGAWHACATLGAYRSGTSLQESSRTSFAGKRPCAGAWPARYLCGCVACVWVGACHGSLSLQKTVARRSRKRPRQGQPAHGTCEGAWRHACGRMPQRHISGRKQSHVVREENARARNSNEELHNGKGAWHACGWSACHSLYQEKSSRTIVHLARKTPRARAWPARYLMWVKLACVWVGASPQLTSLQEKRKQSARRSQENADARSPV
jgi:hypothetical protein